MDTNEAKILKRFEPVALDESQQERYQLLKDAARDMARIVINATAPGREQALALTYLEQASLMASQAICREND